MEHNNRPVEGKLCSKLLFLWDPNLFSRSSKLVWTQVCWTWSKIQCLHVLLTNHFSGVAGTNGAFSVWDYSPSPSHVAFPQHHLWKKPCRPCFVVVWTRHTLQPPLLQLLTTSNSKNTCHRREQVLSSFYSPTAAEFCPPGRIRLMQASREVPTPRHATYFALSTYHGIWETLQSSIKGGHPRLKLWTMIFLQVPCYLLIHIRMVESCFEIFQTKASPIPC